MADSRVRHRSSIPAFFVVASLAAALSLVIVTPAFAAKSGTGDPLFYPCTTCHPVVDGAQGRKLPNDFKGHKIVLDSHAALGKGEAACFVCHEGPGKDPSKLKLIDGSLVDIKGDVSGVCQRCHSALYKEFKAGAHGHSMDKCTAAGCHDPHTPGAIYADPLLPFQGTGFQFGVLPEKQTFRPFAAPATEPPSENPMWLSVMMAIGVVTAGGLAGRLIRGRSKR